MNLYVNRYRAHADASHKNRDVVRQGRSSGWTPLKYGVRRKWKFFWEVYER